MVFFGHVKFSFVFKNGITLTVGGWKLCVMLVVSSTQTWMRRASPTEQSPASSSPHPRAAIGIVDPSSVSWLDFNRPRLQINNA